MVFVTYYYLVSQEGWATVYSLQPRGGSRYYCSPTSFTHSSLSTSQVKSIFIDLICIPLIINKLNISPHMSIVHLYFSRDRSVRSLHKRTSLKPGVASCTRRLSRGLSGQHAADPEEAGASSVISCMFFPGLRSSQKIEALYCNPTPSTVLGTERVQKVVEEGRLGKI